VDSHSRRRFLSQLGAFSEDGLPIGIQAMSAEFDDRTTIEFARLMAQELGGFTPPNGFGG
jgi:amidase